MAVEAAEATATGPAGAATTTAVGVEEEAAGAEEVAEEVAGAEDKPRGSRRSMAAGSTPTGILSTAGRRSGWFASIKPWHGREVSPQR